MKQWITYSKEHLLKKASSLSLSSATQVCPRNSNLKRILRHQLMLATEILATNWYFPVNFTEVKLPMATLMTSNFMLSDDKYGITVKTLHRHITIISLFSLSIHNVTQPLPVYSQYRCSCPFCLFGEHQLLWSFQ